MISVITSHCRPDILPPKVSIQGRPRSCVQISQARLTAWEEQLEIPYRLLNSAPGRHTFGWPTKAAPADGDWGKVWFGCYDPLCPCGRTSPPFLCRTAGAVACVDPVNCTCCVLLVSEVNTKSGVEEVRIQGRVDRHGLAGEWQLGDVAAPGDPNVMAAPLPPTGTPPGG